MSTCWQAGEGGRSLAGDGDFVLPLRRSQLQRRRAMDAVFHGGDGRRGKKKSVRSVREGVICRPSSVSLS